MNFEHIEAARILIDHARESNDQEELEYLTEAANKLEQYLDGDTEVYTPDEAEEESI